MVKARLHGWLDLHGFETGKGEEHEEQGRTQERGNKQTHKITSKTHYGKIQLVTNPLGQLPILISQVHLTLRIVYPIDQPKPI